MMTRKKSDEAARVCAYFESAPLTAASTVLGIVSAIVHRRSTPATAARGKKDHRLTTAAPEGLPLERGTDPHV